MAWLCVAVWVSATMACCTVSVLYSSHMGLLTHQRCTAYLHSCFKNVQIVQSYLTSCYKVYLLATNSWSTDYNILNKYFVITGPLISCIPNCFQSERYTGCSVQLQLISCWLILCSLGNQTYFFNYTNIISKDYVLYVNVLCDLCGNRFSLLSLFVSSSVWQAGLFASTGCKTVSTF